MCLISQKSVPKTRKQNGFFRKMTGGGDLKLETGNLKLGKNGRATFSDLSAVALAKAERAAAGSETHALPF
jgi:hypothetical protein